MACPDGPQYIFQKINTSIFPDPDALMENIRRVTAHIRSKHPDDPRCTLTVLDYSRPWRQYVFIEGARTYDLIERPEQAYKVARQTYCMAVGENRSLKKRWRCPQRIAFKSFCSFSHAMKSAVGLSVFCGTLLCRHSCPAGYVLPAS